MPDSNFTVSALSALRRAQKSAAELGHSYVGSIHFLMALLESRNTVNHLVTQGIDPALIRALAVTAYGFGTPELPLPQGFSRPAGGVFPPGRSSRLWKA